MSKSNPTVKTIEGIADEVNRKLFGIEGVPVKEQRKMVSRAVKAVYEYSRDIEAENKSLKAALDLISAGGLPWKNVEKDGLPEEEEDVLFRTKYSEYGYGYYLTIDGAVNWCLSPNFMIPGGCGLREINEEITHYLPITGPEGKG